jgi:hypothetical protein
MKILAIDPGPESSAYVIWDGEKVLDRAIIGNDDVIRSLGSGRMLDACAIEKIACYGMAVGAEVFETCVWTGRFIERWRDYAAMGDPIRIPRGEIKVHLCRSTKAKDANVGQALIDRFGAPGTKKAPGVLFGVTSHCWAALAVAVCAHDRLSVGIEARA